MTKTLLRLVGPIHIVAGLFVFACAFSPAAASFLQSTLSGNDNYTWSTYFATVIGPTVASWGLLFAALVREFQATPSRRLWNALFGSILIWAPLDTALCLKFGVTVGVAINGFVFFSVLTLLVIERRSLP